ncbi:MAG: hypothetical protein N2Z20_01755 [Elusimicrobiales bacterium]|nr:hypothetical protein [Elusimicrobiales bacterium]
MTIQVEYKNSQGTISNWRYDITHLAIIKHLAVAGMGYFPRLNKMMRIIGMYCHYYPFLLEFLRPRINNFDNYLLNDPTERSHFSTLIGKAIADFLAKRIDN